MIVHEPELIYKEDALIISSKIEIANKSFNMPDRLWFKVYDKYAMPVTDSSNPLLPILLPLSMYLQEDIEFRGRLSEKLYKAMKEYQEYFHKNLDADLKIINIKSDVLYDSYEDSKETGWTGMFFSGGVDSWYTLFSLIESGVKLDKAIIIYGAIGLVLEYKNMFTELYDEYKKVLKEFDIDLIHSQTNALFFTLKYMHLSNNALPFGNVGPNLLANALLFSDYFEKIYVSSTRTVNKENYSTYGTNPTTDRLFSTETMEIIHYAAEVTRAEKTVYVSGKEKTYDHLRVCYSNSVNTRNCCKCKKCLRTMITLDIAGKLSEYSTFPESLTEESIKEYCRNVVKEKHYMKEILELANENGRDDIAEKLKNSLSILDMIKQPGNK